MEIKLIKESDSTFINNHFGLRTLGVVYLKIHKRLRILNLLKKT